jgi:hypothetical protein
MPSTNSAPRNALLLAGMTAAALNAGPGHAAAITETETFSFSTFSLFASTGSPDSDSVGGTLTFDKFDPALGTLTQVEIELISTISGVVNASGFAIDSVDVSSVLDVDLTVDVDGLSPPPVFELTTNFGASCTGTSRCSQIEPFNQAFNGLFTVPANGGDLLDFIGALATFNVDLSGQYDLSCTVNEGTGCTSFANVFWRNELFTLGEVKVTYTYEPTTQVPEPTTLALLGLGAAGLWLTRRRHAAARST